ncbi:MAG: hypothetical protein REV36_02620 [Burkholderia sp.]|nr:hypothetical protein [Burkholderia sp.]
MFLKIVGIQQIQPSYIHASAIIYPISKVDFNSIICPHLMIKARVIIENNVQIDSNIFIGCDVIVSAGSYLYSSVIYLSQM